jgi:hypothetical protein
LFHFFRSGDISFLGVAHNELHPFVLFVKEDAALSFKPVRTTLARGLPTRRRLAARALVRVLVQPASACYLILPGPILAPGNPIVILTGKHVFTGFLK